MLTLLWFNTFSGTQLMGGELSFQLTPHSWKWGCCLCYVFPMCFLVSSAFSVLFYYVAYCIASLVSVFDCLDLACFSNTSRSYFLLSLLWQLLLSPPGNKIKEFCQVLTEERETSVNAETRRPVCRITRYCTRFKRTLFFVIVSSRFLWGRQIVLLTSGHCQ